MSVFVQRARKQKKCSGFKILQILLKCFWIFLWRHRTIKHGFVLCLKSWKVIPKCETWSPDFHTSDLCCMYTLNSTGLKYVSKERAHLILQTMSTSIAIGRVHVQTSGVKPKFWNLDFETEKLSNQLDDTMETFIHLNN